MEYIFYGDESGQNLKNYKAYGIGAFLIPKAQEERYNRVFEELAKKHNINKEIGWKTLNNSYNIINYGMDVLRVILTTSASFTSIIVHKDHFRNWSSGRISQEDAFYQTYTFLLRHIAGVLQATVTAKLDQKSDSYNKRCEVVEVIANNSLKQSSAKITSVEKVNSKHNVGIQIADLLTGAITASRSMYLNENFKINAAKALFINKLSQILGWESLHFDTYPESKFNIWHFPEECRNTPGTKDEYQRNRIAYVTKTEFDAFRAAYE
jgi:hypothetical protein